MNLQDVRVSFESRVGSIEKQKSYLLGKLALVIETQKIAVEIGDQSPVSADVQAEPTGSSSATVTALPASEPSADTLAETSAIEPVEQPDSYSNVAQFTPAAVAEELAEEVGADAAAAETENEAVADTVTSADEAVAEETPAEEAEADPVEAAEDVQAAPWHWQEESIEQTFSNLAVDVEEEALQPWQVEADDDSSENTAEHEELADPEAGEAEADEAADLQAQPDAVADLREKLVAAAAEDSAKSSFLTLGKFLNRAK